MEKLLLYLLSKGAHKEAVRITTFDIADAIGASQQTASRKLLESISDGYVSRWGRNLMLTQKGKEQLARIYRTLKTAFEQPKFQFKGKVVSGVGDGKYYLSLPGYAKPLEKHFGFKPYPGTLNLEIPPEQLELRLQLKAKNALTIPGFSHKGRELGPIHCFPCKIGKISGVLVFPERSHHGLNVLELMAHVDLRKALGLKDGRALFVEVMAE